MPAHAILMLTGRPPATPAPAPAPPAPPPVPPPAARDSPPRCSPPPPFCTYLRWWYATYLQHSGQQGQGFCFRMLVFHALTVQASSGRAGQQWQYKPAGAVQASRGSTGQQGQYSSTGQLKQLGEQGQQGKQEGRGSRGNRGSRGGRGRRTCPSVDGGVFRGRGVGIT